MKKDLFRFSRRNWKIKREELLSDSQSKSLEQDSKKDIDEAIEKLEKEENEIRDLVIGELKEIFFDLPDSF
ncbi:hypothetical protein [uncultured Tenacibaculum sp.]|uniref:hypothetical protein n=1 Tax=uncultured Tenacibaculum sp. TaxID=174713 RepID=UPI002612BC02|nr:hypothetical protein [uncultured Tenacibaculum sp.]